MDSDTLLRALEKVQEFTRLVEKPIESYLLATVEEDLKEPILHQAKSGGKRLRPGMVLLSCWAVNGNPKDAVPAAAAIEILHTYSLVIDDIIDNADLRRGQATTWKRYGMHLGLLTGILHREAAFLAMQDTSNPQLVESLLSKSICRATQGEILDLKYTMKESVIEKDTLPRPTSMTIDDYNRMIWLKTAQFFGVACRIGALEGKANERQQRLAQQYGDEVGLAFQIMDDVLDLKGNPAEFGKETGKDLKEGKLGNLPLLLAFLDMNEQEKSKLLEILKRGANKEDDVDTAIHLIEKYDGINRAIREAQQHAEKAKRSIQNFPNKTAVEMMELLADYMILRNK